MNSPTNSPSDGGPAFPQNDAHVNRINNLDGMSLRDYFAGQVLPVVARLPLDPQTADCITAEAKSHGVTLEILVANLAYDYADAMLAARERKS